MDNSHSASSTTPPGINNSKSAHLLNSDFAEFTVVFKGEALTKLKDLASSLDVDPEKLGDVLVKGIHIMDMAKDADLIIERKKHRVKIDVKKL